MPEVSIFASAVRPHFFKTLLDSLKDSSINLEIIFGGNNPLKLGLTENIEWPSVHYKYILTGNIKPTQVYEICRRHCTGETVVWVADDCEFRNDILGKAYRYWKSKNNEKLILSLQTKESGYGDGELKLFSMNQHCFFGRRPDTPLMAPIGMMSRKFLDELGGLDRRFICGQYENQIVMMAYTAAGSVEIFGDEDCYVEIDHLRKSIELGESKTRQDFLNRPFAKGYPNDRRVLENSWVRNGVVSFERADKHEPYDDKDILIKSQSNNLPEMWD